MSVNAVKGSQQVNTITIRVYHDTWVKTVDGWRKTTSTWYRLDWRPGEASAARLSARGGRRPPADVLATAGTIVTSRPISQR